MTLSALLALAIAAGERISGVEPDDAGSSPPKTAGKAPGAKAPRAGSEDLQKRWESLPEKRRAELQRIHQRLQELDPAERRTLMEKLRSMPPKERREAIRRARDEAGASASKPKPAPRKSPPFSPPEGAKARKDALRERIEKLPPAARNRLLDASPAEIRAYLAERRKATLSKLPPDAREKAESLPPREQAEFLRRFRGEQLFRETFRDPAEVKALRNLSPREAADALGIGKSDVRGLERPAFLSEDTWSRWKALRPFERPRVLRHILQGRNGGEGGSDSPRPRAKTERKQP